METSSNVRPDLNRIRQIYLTHLTGKISPAETKELNSAMMDPRVRGMCKELQLLYSDPQWHELLMLKPTSERWNELYEKMMQAMEEKNRQNVLTNRRFLFWITLITIGLAFLAGYLILWFL